MPPRCPGWIYFDWAMASSSHTVNVYQRLPWLFGEVILYIAVRSGMLEDICCEFLQARPFVHSFETLGNACGLGDQLT